MTQLTFFILITIGAVVIFYLGYQVGSINKDVPSQEPEKSNGLKTERVKMFWDLTPEELEQIEQDTLKANIRMKENLLIPIFPEIKPLKGLLEENEVK